MNQTEAWEAVLTAAAILHGVNASTTKGKGPVYIDVLGDTKPRNLTRALTIIEPRVARMRSRLDHARARRAGKPLCPKGLEP